MHLLISLFLILYCTIDWIYFPHPYLWGSLLAAFCFICFALIAERKAAKILLSIIAFFLILWGALELEALVFGPHENFDVPAFYIPNDILGYAPKKSTKIYEQKYRYGKLRYTATYTIDNDGLRITPLCDTKRCNSSVLFFGSSFAFGLGIADDETLPYLVGLRDQTKIYNFGFVGYGPNQMLREIDTGLVRHIVQQPAQYAILETLYLDIQSSAGYMQVNQSAPKYVLNKDGSVKFAGHFNDSPLTRIINELVYKSSIYQNYFIFYTHSITKEDVQRYLALIIASKNALQKI